MDLLIPLGFLVAIVCFGAALVVGFRMRHTLDQWRRENERSLRRQ
jgi:hypothetical protein